MDFNTHYQQAIENYESKTPESKKAYSRARAVIAGGETRSVSYYDPYPIAIEKATGSTLTDLDHNQYTDFISNYTSLIHGYNHPYINESMEKALHLGTAYPAGITEQVRLAELLCERVPSFESIRFCNSGTESTMFAIRAARAYTHKTGIIKMQGGYHGTTDIMEYNVSKKPMINALTHQIEPRPDTLGISESIAQDVFIARFNDSESVRQILDSESAKIAAIIVEPVLGASGVIPANRKFLISLRNLATKYGVVLIFDEVQTLRLSFGGAQEKYNVIPDLTAVGKIIGGGLPVGAFGGKKEIMSVFDPISKNSLSQSGTFNGNRMTMAAGIASMELLNDDAIKKLEQLGYLMYQEIQNIINELNIPISVTHAGSLLNIHFIPNAPDCFEDLLNENKNLYKLYHLEMLNRGIFTAPRGTIVLSTVMTENDVQNFASAFYETMLILKNFL